MTVLEIGHRLDARGLACPMPIVKTAQTIKTLASGELLEVVATDAGSVKDFAAWSKSTGHELVDQTCRTAGVPLRPPPEVRQRP